MIKHGEYFDHIWKKMSFWEKVYYHLISTWGWIEFAWQITLHKVFGVDWHKNDKVEDDE